MIVYDYYKHIGEYPSVSDKYIHEYEHEVYGGKPCFIVKVTGGIPDGSVTLDFDCEMVLGDPHTNKAYSSNRQISSTDYDKTLSFKSSHEWKGVYSMPYGSNVLQSTVTVSNADTGKVYASQTVTIIHHWD